MAKTQKARPLPVKSRDFTPALGDRKLHPPGSAMLSEQAWKEIAHSLKLSGRELQIVRGVFDDHTELAIASNLRISTHTVHSHCERLHHKLAVNDRAKLILRIVDEFLTLTVAPGSTLPSICAIRTAGRCPLQRPLKQKTPLVDLPSYRLFHHDQQRHTLHHHHAANV